MRLPGEATDKFGNRYEGRWTVYCMADLLDWNVGIHVKRQTH